MWVALRVYHRVVVVVNRHWTREPGPLIIVSNHPATLLDPFHAVVNVRGVTFFLANASLFKYRWSAWLLNRLYCIPIERQQDTNGKPLRNEANFARTAAHLKRGGKIYIAVEGTSYVERRLRKVKTGTARIALSTEASEGYKLNLRILPVGLEYDDPTRFRHPAMVTYDEPIRVADFKEVYEQDPTQGVLALTDAIRERLERLIIDTRDEVEDAFLRKIEILLHSDEPVKTQVHFRRARVWLERLRYWQQVEPESFESFRLGVEAYFDTARGVGVSDAAVVRPLCPLRLTLLLVGAPLAMLGWLVHAPACYGTMAFCRLLNKDIHWEPTYKFVVGLVMYPLAYWLESGLLSAHVPGGSWGFLAGFVLLGLWTEWYLAAGRLALEQLRYALLPAAERQALASQRQWLRQQMGVCPALPSMQPN